MMTEIEKIAYFHTKRCKEKQYCRDRAMSFVVERLAAAGFGVEESLKTAERYVEAYIPEIATA